MKTARDKAGRAKLLLLAAILTVYAIASSNASAANADKPPFNYETYAQVLKTCVDDTGMVDYKQLKANRTRLDIFALAMTRLDSKIYKNWSDSQKVAFWLNAYNALTLKAIIDNYPIKSSFFKSRIYPKNSIRQIPGVWSKIKFKIMRKNTTLSHIEHEILRKEFDEPRIHMAMVCAAMSCPPLRNEPYTAEKLDAQLNDQTKKFLAEPKKFKIDRKNNKVYLSPIFKWFAADFITKYATKTPIPGQDKNVSAVINFITKHCEDNIADYLKKGKFKVEYLKYDWSLNEQPKKKQAVSK